MPNLVRQEHNQFILGTWYVKHDYAFINWYTSKIIFIINTLRSHIDASPNTFFLKDLIYFNINPLSVSITNMIGLYSNTIFLYKIWKNHISRSKMNSTFNVKVFSVCYIFFCFWTCFFQDITSNLFELITHIWKWPTFIPYALNSKNSIDNVNKWYFSFWKWTLIPPLWETRKGLPMMLVYLHQD